MSSSSSRWQAQFLALPLRWRVAIGSGAAFLLGSSALSEARQRAELSRVLDERDCRSSVEVARHPCQVLSGYDVVVRNYFYDTTKAQRDDAAHDKMSWASRLRKMVLPIWWQSPDVMDSRLGGAAGLGVSQSKQNGEADRLSSVRRVGGVSPPQPATSSNEWPEGTSRFAGMTIEPSRQSDSTSTQIHERGFLRALVDRSTQQTLVKCDGRSHTTAAECSSDPAFLSAPYLRNMVAAVALLPQPLPPLRLCFLGVGGGALPMFIQKYFAAQLAKVDLVDIEPEVFRAASEHMGLRQVTQSHPMTLVAAEASEFLSTNARSASPDSYDVVFVDLFVGSELPGHVESTDFVLNVKKSLSSIGVAVFNLPSRNDAFQSTCMSAFGSSNVIVAPCKHSSNQVLFALNRPGDGLSKRQVLRRCQKATAVYHLPYDIAAHFPYWWWWGVLPN